MDLLRIIYSSQPFGYDEAMLGGILLDARRCNARDGVTGSLVCRRDIYLQLLEGPEAAVQATFARIRKDERHVNVVLRASSQVTERMFGNWAMLHDPVRTVIWSEDDIAGGILDRAGLDDFRQVFDAISENAAFQPLD